MVKRLGTLWHACTRALRRQHDQRVAFVRVRSVRLCHQEIAVSNYRGPFVSDQVSPCISRGLELDTTHPGLGNVKGAARSHADAGNQATIRRPVSWEMLIAGEKLISTRQTGGLVL